MQGLYIYIGPLLGLYQLIRKRCFTVIYVDRVIKKFENVNKNVTLLYVFDVL